MPVKKLLNFINRYKDIDYSCVSKERKHSFLKEEAKKWGLNKKQFKVSLEYLN